MSATSTSTPDPYTAASLALAACLALALYAGTPWGLGLTPDSVAYVSAARALAEHLDFMQLPSHWPPLYPVLLAVSQTLAGDFVLGSRLLQASFMFGNVVLIALLLRHAGHGRILGGLLLTLIVSQPGFLAVHLRLWTEPAFLALMLLDLLILRGIMLRPATTGRLVLLGLVAGLATLVRYTGLFLLIVNGIVLLFAATRGTAAEGADRAGWRFFPGARAPCRASVRNAFLAGAVALAPMLAWTGFNRWRGIAATDREFVWHPVGADHLGQAADTFGQWFHLPKGLGMLAVLLVGLGALWAIMARRPDNGSGIHAATIRLLAICLMAYPAMLLASVSLFDFHTPLDNRILVPMLPVALALLAHLAWNARRRLVPLVLGAFVLLGLAFNLPDSQARWLESRADGIGFARKAIRTMPILEVLRRAPADWKVASNGPELFQLYLEQGASLLPMKLDPVSRRPNPGYSAEIRALAGTADAIVWFAPMGFRRYLPGDAELNRLDGFRLVYARPDGVIWVRERAR